MTTKSVFRVALVLGVFAVTGCRGDDKGGTSAAEPVDRAMVTQAFRVAGEPLELRVDMAEADPESLVDAIYVPRDSGAESVFEVSLFEDEGSAARQVESLPTGDFARQKNVVLFLSPAIVPTRRERLVAVLASLSESQEAFRTFNVTVLSGTLRNAPAPPVIVESFNVLPCPDDPVSTLDLIGCAQRALLRSDRAIDTRAKVIYRRLRSGSARIAFVRSERSWLRYRRSSCAAEASVFAGGSVQPVALLRCQLDRNRTHLADLAQLERSLRPK